MPEEPGDALAEACRRRVGAALLVLEFYEHLLEQTNLASDDAESPRFLFGELFAFARDRLREELPAAAPDEDTVRKVLRGLWPTLVRFRFVREVERDGADAGDDPEDRDDDQILYEALPALHHYDLRRLAPGPDARHVVVISSILARIAVPGYTGYSASKAGLLGLVRSFAAELAADDVQVNAICPGWVDTDMARLGLDLLAQEIGGTREDAYAMVQPLAMRVWDEDRDFRDLVLSDPSIAGHLSPDEIDRIFDLKTQLRNVDRIFERTLKQ